MLANRILICGDRNWSSPLDELMIISLLDGLYEEHMIGYGVLHLEPFVVIEGHAKGADSVAHWWATKSPLHDHGERAVEFGAKSSFEHLCFPAEWDKYGKAAGPIRNQRMLDEGKPNLVVAFHDDLEYSKGTQDMCTRANAAGVPVYVMGMYDRPVPNLFN